MGVTIFGAKSSPVSASYVLHQTATGHCVDSPEDLADATAVREHFYIDYFLYSSKSAEAAKQAQKEFTVLLAPRGFRLTKWKGNN